MAKASCSTDKAHANTLLNPSTCVSSCEDYELSRHHKECSKYKQTHDQEKLHSCCIHNIDLLQQNCSLHKEKQKFEDNLNCSKEKLNTKEHRRSFSRNLQPNKHLHKNIVNPTTEELTYKCSQTACHDTLHDPGETCQESHKCCNTLKETCTCEPQSMSTDRECNESCNHLSPNLCEEEPLITLKQCSETPEVNCMILLDYFIRIRDYNYVFSSLLDETTKIKWEKSARTFNGSFTRVRRLLQFQFI